MTGGPTVLYLEADDEVTSVVRRLRAAEPGPVVVVAPGRSRATSSVTALRLLARSAAADGRPLTVVGDALTRSLAAEAGVPAHASLDDARRGVAPEPPEPVRAAISVVRGPIDDETAPTLLAAPRPASSPPAPPAEEITRPVRIPDLPPPVARPRARPPRRPARGPLLALAVLGSLLVAGTAAGALLLPAATVVLQPRTVAVGPIDATVELAEVEELSGTVSAEAEVVASGTYEISELATGTVVFFNWTFFPVTVPAGTFVAAGEQAFATQAEIVVPRGRLTPDGRIQAGDAEVAVLAAAAGEAANVPAEAIDTVLNESVDAQLRGFPENPERRVTNPQPTSGGLVASGPEIVQADVDGALERLRADLAARAEAAIPDDGIVLVEPAPEPRIESAEDLVGRRDEERVTISGELDWSATRADPTEAEERARELLLGDPDAVPAGFELLPETIAITLGDARRDGANVVVPATVRASAVPLIDVDEVRRRVTGLPPVEAMAELAEIGSARVELWPGWVAEVPALEWRIEVRVEAADAVQPPPAASDEPGTSP